MVGVYKSMVRGSWVISSEVDIGRLVMGRNIVVDHILTDQA